jgi:hypothetical protein
LEFPLHYDIIPNGTMHRILIAIISVALVLTCGCAELNQTARLAIVAFAELFRLPVFCLRLPFQILQGMAPVLQSAIQTGARLAPLLLFIERRTPKDSLYARGDSGGSLEENVENALSMESSVPLLPLLESEVNHPEAMSFALVDADLMRNVRVRRAFLRCFAGARGNVTCVMVDGTEIFARQGRFVEVCRLMSVKGDSLYALTGFNDRLADLTGTPLDALPPDARGLHLIREWNGWLERLEKDAGS